MAQGLHGLYIVLEGRRENANNHYWFKPLIKGNFLFKSSGLVVGEEGRGGGRGWIQTNIQVPSMRMEWNVILGQWE